jgi:hypothetical protein
MWAIVTQKIMMCGLAQKKNVLWQALNNMVWTRLKKYGPLDGPIENVNLNGLGKN